jgi:hypothetical protein
VLPEPAGIEMRLEPPDKPRARGFARVFPPELEH